MNVNFPKITVHVLLLFEGQCKISFAELVLYLLIFIILLL